MSQALERYLAAAEEAAREAGRLLLSALHDADRKIEYKGEFDLVTEMDRRAEEMIKAFLIHRFPHIAVLAEEGGATGDYSGMRWIIDPLDGTTSYAHRLPHFCVSIALEVEGSPRLGVVYNPCLDECFTALQGEGARLNGRPIRVSQVERVSQGLMATGFPYDREGSGEKIMRPFGAFFLKAQGIRRMGSAALDLCYVAAGRFDGFWEVKLKPWDTAAGVVILREAGGEVTDFSGEAFSIYGESLLASNSLLHDEMMTILRGAQQ